MKKVILFGNGQVASVAYFYLTHDSPYEVAAFTVDQEYINEDAFLGLPVVPFEDVESVYSPDDYDMLVSISFRKVNKLRAEKYCEAKAKGYQVISYVSSKAITWPGLEIGENCMIGENSIIQPFAKIGDNVIIGSNCVVGHHTVVKDHCFLTGSVTLSGSVTVEPYCFFGVNSTIRDRVTVAKESIISAGALILEDTQERGVYMGEVAEQLPISSDELSLG